ncbi:MAG: ABC transporter ATP-binding protein [Nitrospinota bacterium]|nr:ABC transporter ATP-binding protein [Nitrospinota bacterium]
MDNQEVSLQLENVTKEFGGLTAVDDVSFTLGPGDRRGILGPNGAGKTTLFHLITGVIPVSRGRVTLFEQDVTNWPTHKRVELGLARTFQITSLFSGLSVYENVLLAVQGLSKTKMVMFRPISKFKTIHDKVEELLTTSQFWGKKDTQIKNLSHGEQRQLEIVLALASDPKVLMLDEPTAGLATGESAEMANFLNTLSKDIAILIIEHDLDVIFEVAEHILVLHYGKLLTDGSVDEVKNNQQVQEIYLGQG